MRAISIFIFISSCLCGIAFLLLLNTSTGTYFMALAEVEDNLPGRISIAGRFPRIVSNIGIFGTVLSAIGLACVAINPIWKRFEKKLLVTSALLLASMQILLIWHLWGTVNIANYAFRKVETEASYYKETISGLLLIEEVMDDKAMYRDFVGQKIRQPVEKIQPENQDDVGQSDFDINVIFWMMIRTNDEKLARRLLATIAIHSHDFHGMPNTRDFVLDYGNRLARQRFTRIDDFYEWVLKQDQSKWSPLPSFQFDRVEYHQEFQDFFIPTPWFFSKNNFKNNG